jgi:hypothetical protein
MRIRHQLAAVSFAAVAVFLCVFIAATADAALPPPSLTGEVLPILDQSGSPPFPGTFTIQGSCSDDASTLTFSGTGTAVGPYPGPFTVNGSITLGPNLIPGNSGYQRTVTSFAESFAITSPNGDVTGTKQLDPTLDGVADELGQVYNEGSCSMLGSDLSANVALRATYSALITTGSATYQDLGRNVVEFSQNDSGNGSVHAGFFSENYGSNLDSSGGPTPVAPTSITLTPSTGTATVGAPYTVTATLSGGANANQPVVFSVAGASSATGSCTTGSTGACSFTFTGPQTPGADTITACFDSNGNGQVDASDSPCTTATVTFQLPPAQLFAANTVCGSSNGLVINGSHITVGGGGEHSNGSLTVNGSSNTATYGSSGGPNGCKATVNGSGNTFQGMPRPIVDPVAEPYPDDYRTQVIPCTYSGASFTFNTSNATIPAGVYCATATITVNGSNDTGNVTLIGQSVLLNGSGYAFTANMNNLLVYEKGSSQLTVNGSGSSLSGAIFAPSATIALNGGGGKEISGPIEGLNVTLNGSNWSVG